MRVRILSVVFAVLLCLAAPLSGAFAGEASSGFIFNARRASISAMLSANVDRNVTVVLKSGAKMGGRIVDIKGDLVYLSDERMKGRTNNHVLIRIDSIDALVFDAEEFR